MTSRALLASFAAFAVGLASFVGCTSLLGDFDVAVVETGDGAPGKTNGVACGAGSECASSFCVDGVCCESSCSGTCETCSLEPGRCVAVPDGQDPDQECLPEELPDAGVIAPPEAGPFDGGDPDGGGGETEVKDGGTEVNVPDGGLVSDAAPCAGSCNGARACKYPAREVSCGSKFCNTGSQAAGFACDGKGHCQLDLEQCASFSCENDACRTTCAEQNDCQDTHFCNTSGICQERLSNGLGCSLADQCKSGFCVVEGGSGVCCNSPCDVGTFGPGASCKGTGSVGQCKCSLDCGAGSCRLVYRDNDGDGFGDPNVSQVGCDNVAAPVGWTVDRTDCDDSDARAFPGQTQWFAGVSNGGTFDFNCNGKLDKEIPEYPGEACKICGEPTRCSSSDRCPVGKNADRPQSRLSCALYKNVLGGYTCGYSAFVSNTEGFTTEVQCGQDSGSYRVCGACNAVSIGIPSTTATRQQRCR